MNAKRAKKLRKAFNEVPTESVIIWHPKQDLGLVRYVAQYVNTGKPRLVKTAKRIYSLAGVMPYEPTNR